MQKYLKTPYLENQKIIEHSYLDASIATPESTLTAFPLSGR